MILRLLSASSLAVRQGADPLLEKLLQPRALCARSVTWTNCYQNHEGPSLYAFAPARMARRSVLSFTGSLGRLSTSLDVLRDRLLAELEGEEFSEEATSSKSS